MNIFVRTDSSVDIGLGHVMRCLTLAEELCKRGATVNFICRDLPGNICHLIKQKGFKTGLLYNKFIDQETDAMQTKAELNDSEMRADWIIADHYFLSKEWENMIRPIAKKIMVIDDFNNRYHNCDLLLNQNLSQDIGSSYDGFIPDNCQKLLGPTYSLLRPEFLHASHEFKRHIKEAKRLLVFFGGSDPTNETSKTLLAIQMLNMPDIETIVIIGTSNPFRAEIERLALQIKGVTCYFNPENIAELMAASDICIGAGGSSTWERCCMGLPSIVISVAENQRRVIEDIGRQGIVVDMGCQDKINEFDLKNEIENLIKDIDKRRMMSVKSKGLVDGKGSNRVADIMLGTNPS